jgi:hypothetical protein
MYFIELKNKALKSLRTTALLSCNSAPGADIVVDDFGERHTSLLQAGILDHRVVDTVVEGAFPVCTDPKWMS